MGGRMRARVGIGGMGGERCRVGVLPRRRSTRNSRAEAAPPASEGGQSRGGHDALTNAEAFGLPPHTTRSPRAHAGDYGDPSPGSPKTTPGEATGAALLMSTCAPAGLG